jgi:hypothetical protein
VVGAGTVVLTCYAFVIKAQAESLLRDVAALALGVSSKEDVEKLARRHKWYLESEVTHNHEITISFKVQNTWLSTLRLEPPARFTADVTLTDGKVNHIGAFLFRSIDIYPTFSGSAGIVDEYAEYPRQYAGREHYAFLTPVGKPYLRIVLDSRATPIQRQHAFGFSFRCLVKPGWGCDLPCDYLPLAWRDWKDYLESVNFLDVFNQHYPNSSRCKP